MVGLCFILALVLGLFHQLEESLADQRQGGALAGDDLDVGDQAVALRQQAAHAVDSNPSDGVGDRQIADVPPERTMKAMPSIW